MRSSRAARARAAEKIKAMTATGIVMAASPAELGTTLVEAAKRAGLKLS